MYFPDDQFALFKFRTKMHLAASVRDGVAESATFWGKRRQLSGHEFNLIAH
jgi:hypothetical protein